jgi:hypothetical protein
MTIRQDIFRALHDAIGWQSGLADANHAGPERRECLDQVKRYKTILKKWYGTDRTRFDELIAQCKLVDITELKPRKDD